MISDFGSRGTSRALSRDSPYLYLTPRDYHCHIATIEAFQLIATMHFATVYAYLAAVTREILALPVASILLLQPEH